MPVSQAAALWKSGLGEGFRVPALLRFVNEEDPYLAASNGGPRMYINMEDHLSHSLKTPNIPFQVRADCAGCGAHHQALSCELNEAGVLSCLEATVNLASSTKIFDVHSLQSLFCGAFAT